MGMRGIVRAIGKAWTSVQVEHHGKYSIERIHSFYKYSLTKKSLWLLTVCVLTPIPCLLLNTVMDFVHLEPPSAGREANYLFWGRSFLTFALISAGVLLQFSYLIPQLGMTPRRILLFAVISATVAIAADYWLAGVMGFPVPFLLVVGAPFWFVSISLLFTYYYAQRLRQDATLRSSFFRVCALLCGKFGLTIVYPIYIYGLTSIPETYINAYVLLLPLLKIVCKNVISIIVGHNDDVKPELVIFNVEIFNALYVSLAMQSVRSVLTTAILLVVDLLQAWMGLRRFYREILQVKALSGKIPSTHALHGRNILEVAVQLTNEKRLATVDQLHKLGSSSPARLNSIVISTKSAKKSTSSSSAKVGTTEHVNSADFRRSKLVLTKLPKWRSIIHPRIEPAPSVSGRTTTNTGHSVYNAVKTQSPQQYAQQNSWYMHECGMDDDEQAEFIRRSAQILFTMEFIILIEYTEVIVPILYSIYLAAMFYLPNRQYYPNISDIDASQLEQMIGNVLIYASLELLSCLAIGVLLKRMTGVSALHQLGFVLQTQWEMVQSKLLLWIFYSVQNSLQHMGTSAQIGVYDEELYDVNSERRAC